MVDGVQVPGPGQEACVRVSTAQRDSDSRVLGARDGWAAVAVAQRGVAVRREGDPCQGSSPHRGTVRGTEAADDHRAGHELRLGGETGRVRTSGGAGVTRGAVSRPTGTSSPRERLPARAARDASHADSPARAGNAQSRTHTRTNNALASASLLIVRSDVTGRKERTLRCLFV